MVKKPTGHTQTCRIPFHPTLSTRLLVCRAGQRCLRVADCVASSEPRTTDRCLER